MDNEMNNMFSGLFQMQSEDSKQRNEQPSPNKGEQGLSEAERAAYSAYRNAVIRYPELVSQKEKAAEELKRLKSSDSVLPGRVSKLEREYEALQKEKSALSLDLSKQQSGTGGSRHLAEVVLDTQTAGLVRDSRNSMTAAQKAFMELPAQEVCGGKVITSAEVVESLESSFRNTALYSVLRNGTTDPATVKKASNKISFFAMIAIAAVLALGRLTQWDILYELGTWMCAIGFCASSAMAVWNGAQKFGKLIRYGATGLVIWFMVPLGSAMAHAAMTESNAGGIAFLVIASFIVSRAVGSLCKRPFVLPVLQKLGLLRDIGWREAYRDAESMTYMNEALYCYCNHDAVMQTLRENFRKNEISRLNAMVQAKARQIADKGQELARAKTDADQSAAKVRSAQKRLDDTVRNLENANNSILTWNGRPDEAMDNNQMADLICLEGKSASEPFRIIRHNKKPMVYYYTGDTYSNPVSQAADALIAVSNGFTKLNPSSLMKLSILNLSGGDLPNSMIVRLDTVDWSRMKGPSAGTENVGKIFYAGNRTELEDVKKILDEHVLSIRNFIMTHRNELLDGADIGRINQLLARDNRRVNPYHVLLIMVPREKEQTVANADYVINYVRDAQDCADKGIIPVFFVNSGSVHEQWRNVIASAKKIN